MRVAVAWMGGCHALIGAVEGVLTAVSVAALARRDLLAPLPATSAGSAVGRTRAGWFAPVLALAAVAAVLVPLASKRPDVLETLLQHAGR
jgi:hypothetical protein